MNPGSREINTPGTFRADSKAMMFKPMDFKKQDLKDIPKQKMQGASGGLGLIGGAAAAGAKALGKAAAKAFAKRNPGVTLGGATKNLPKGTGKPRTGKGNIHPIVTGGRSMKKTIR